MKRAARPRKASRAARKPARPTYPDLATYLAESGDTQARLAARTGTTQAYISRLVAGRLVPRPLLGLRIATYANVPLDSFARAYVARNGGGA